MVNTQNVAKIVLMFSNGFSDMTYFLLENIIHPFLYPLKFENKFNIYSLLLDEMYYELQKVNK